MMEMRQKERKELVETLWKQTENYLVRFILLTLYNTTSTLNGPWKEAF